MDPRAAPFHDGRGYDPIQQSILACQDLEQLTRYILLNHFEFNMVHCSTALNKFGGFRKDKQPLQSREQGALKVLVDLSKGKQFLPKQASAMIRAVGVGNLTEDKGVHELLDRLIIEADFTKWRPKELALVVEALTALGLEHPGFFNAMDKELSRRGLKSFNAQDITSFIIGYAELSPSSSTGMELFLNELLTRDLSHQRTEIDVNNFTLQRLTSIICGLAQSGNNVSTELTKKLATEFASRPLKHLKPAEVANVTWAFTSLKMQPPNLFEKLILGIFMKTTKVFSYHQLGNIAWAFATFKSDQTPKLFDALSKELKIRREKEGDTATLVNIIWAFAYAGYPSQSMFTKLANELIQYRALDTLEVDQLAYLAWGFAKSNIRNPPLYDKIVKAVETKSLKNSSAASLATLGWALSTSDHTVYGVVKTISSELGSRDFRDYQVADLIDTLLAIANSGTSPAIQVLSRVFEEIKTRGITELNPSNLSSVLLGYGKIGWNETEVFESVAEVLALCPLDQFSTTDLANIFWSYSTLGFFHRVLFDRIAAECTIRHQTKKVPNSDLITIAWGLACNELMHSAVSMAFFDLVPVSISSYDRTTRNASMLNNCIISWKQSHPNATTLPILLDQLMVGGWVDQQLPRATSGEHANVQSQVSEALQQMGYVHMLENFRNPEGLLVNIRLTNNVTVEIFNEKQQYLIDGSTIRGEIAFKNRLLENVGYWIVVVGIEEWNALTASISPENETEIRTVRENFLTAKLDELYSSYDS